MICVHFGTGSICNTLHRYRIAFHFPADPFSSHFSRCLSPCLHHGPERFCVGLVTLSSLFFHPVIEACSLPFCQRFISLVYAARLLRCTHLLPLVRSVSSLLAKNVLAIDVMAVTMDKELAL